MTTLYRHDGKLLVRGGKLAIHERCCCGDQQWACVEVWEGFWFGECDPPTEAHEPAQGTCPDSSYDWDGWDSPMVVAYQCIPLPAGKTIGDWVNCYHSCTLSSDDFCNPPPDPAVCIVRAGYARLIISVHATEADCIANCSGG